jgi:hypothetical protein
MYLLHSHTIDAQQKPKNGECALPVTLGSAQVHKSTLQTKKMKQNQMENKNMKRITKSTYSGFALLALACFALSPGARAVSPPPDGGYPRGNTAEGENALLNLGGDYYNTAVGYNALSVGSPGQGVGSYNTAVGAYALMHNFGEFYDLGISNTATGAFALYSNGSGARNTATGSMGLYGNQNGDNNTADGYQALYSNTSGNNNTATGYQALGGNTSGGNNTATGVHALGGDGTGSFNTATGFGALGQNTTGHHNTGDGVQALSRNASGYKNTATGYFSLPFNTAGHDNIAVGNNALQNNTTGSFNIGLGSNAGANLTTGSDNIVIGAPGVAGESNTMRIGTHRQTATFIGGINGAVVTGAPVVVNGASQLGIAPSSERFKNHIQPMDSKSKAILSLRPVTFHYKTDTKATPQFGLIAEEVAKVDPALVLFDKEGKPYTVRYEAVNAMLLNEFLKEHRKNEKQEATITALKANDAKQEATITQQQRQIDALIAGLKEQAAQIQKVSVQLEVSKAAPQTVLNNQ